MENNDFVLFILQVCAHVVTGMGKDFTGWGPFSRGGDRDFTFEIVVGGVCTNFCEKYSVF